MTPPRPAPPSPSRTGQPGRREVLALAAGLAGAGLSGPSLAWTGGIGAAFAQDPAPAGPSLGDGDRFEAGFVVELARALAKKPFAAPATDLPDPLNNLTYEQYVAIRPQSSALVWADEGRGFVVEPLHRGFVFTTPVALHVVEDGTVRRIAYDRNRYAFGKLKAPEEGRDLGFSGFRLYASFGGNPPADCAIFQGASFFRALAAGQSYGVTARALTLRPAEAKGEEFPIFRAFWIERPNPGSGHIAIHALVDSVSATAALHMTLRPGDATIVDVEATLCPRTTLEHVGIAGITGAYLFGPNDRRNIDDARAAAHETGALQIRNGWGEALWRPIQNPETLQISAFMDQDPKGFGLVQRDRDYAAFEDDVQRWERRPSLWIEPLSTWGPGVAQRPWGAGAVQLIEIPSESEVNENILSYWRPKEPIAKETAFSYRQFWCWTAPGEPPLARCTGTRVGKGASGKRRLFLVDFTGEGLFAPGLKPDALSAALGTSPGTIVRQVVYSYPERKTVRVLFELDPGNDTACELRLTLKAADQPLSETWLYRWTP
ncbi:glucan biosynthesis protein D [uncultured Methylobacterium sp.]|jgi:glucans biosynthesis protein|uniref:glucan biosynthesis protein n=1 Tax=uncultured Methylobacterium sp. TaxID=157278 RepID=UPI00262FA731|nr:glucan biosynthesis protein D [uncultured Methylobacterium sp.]